MSSEVSRLMKTECATWPHRVFFFLLGYIVLMGHFVNEILGVNVFVAQTISFLPVNFPISYSIETILLIILFT